MPLDPELVQEIREQKKIDLAEDDRDFGPDDWEIDCWLDRYETSMGLVGL